MKLRRWEVVEVTMNEYYATDVTVPPRVLVRCWTRRQAEWVCYHRFERPRALSGIPAAEYRRIRVEVRRAP